MAPQVPIRCAVTLTLTIDIDVTEKTTLKNKMTQIVQDLKTQFPDRISENRIQITTDFAVDDWKV